MWGWGEHLAIQLSRLFCMPGGWVGACVPVAGGGGGAACVWAGAGGGLAMFAEGALPQVRLACCNSFVCLFLGPGVPLHSGAWCAVFASGSSGWGQGFLGFVISSRVLGAVLPIFILL